MGLVFLSGSPGDLRRIPLKRTPRYLLYTELILCRIRSLLQYILSIVDDFENNVVERKEEQDGVHFRRLLASLTVGRDVVHAASNEPALKSANELAFCTT